VRINIYRGKRLYMYAYLIFLKKTSINQKVEHSHIQTILYSRDRGRLCSSGGAATSYRLYVVMLVGERAMSVVCSSSCAATSYRLYVVMHNAGG
jgi:hypothetical protein